MQYNYSTEDNEVNHILQREREAEGERERMRRGRVYTCFHQQMCAFFLVPIRSLTKGRWKRKEEKESKKGLLRLSFAAAATAHHTQHKTPRGRRQ